MSLSNLTSCIQRNFYSIFQSTLYFLFQYCIKKLVPDNNIKIDILDLFPRHVLVSIDGFQPSHPGGLFGWDAKHPKGWLKWAVFMFLSMLTTFLHLPSLQFSLIGVASKYDTVSATSLFGWHIKTFLSTVSTLMATDGTPPSVKEGNLYASREIKWCILLGCHGAQYWNFTTRRQCI